MGLLSKWVESLNYEYEIRSSCTRHRSPHSTCQKCVAACENQAISIVNGKPILDPDKCVQCGRCMAACPVQAIAGILPQRNIIQNQHVMADQSIPTSKELLILYKKGIKSIIYDEEASLHLWKEPIEEANTKLGNLGESPFSVSAASSVREEEEHYSRREIFSLWKKESKSFLQQFTPAEWRLNHNSFDLIKYYPDYQFTTLTLNSEKCTLCSVCQRLCEKKCFDMNEDNFSISLKGCNSCQLCVDTCPEKAITLEDKIVKIEETVFPIYEKVCLVCNQPFNTLRHEDENCPACTKLGSFSK